MLEIFERHASLFVTGGALVCVSGLLVIVLTLYDVTLRRAFHRERPKLPDVYVRVGIALFVVGLVVTPVAIWVRSSRWERACATRCGGEARVRENKCECFVQSAWIAAPGASFDPSPAFDEH